MKISSLSYRDLIWIVLLVCGFAVSWGAQTVRLNAVEVKVGKVPDLKEDIAVIKETLKNIECNNKELKSDIKEIKQVLNEL